MITTTYSLAEVVAAGNAPSVRWLQREIRARHVSARKIGRHWRMTDQDITDMLEALRNVTPTLAAPVHHPNPHGLSATSLRRLQKGGGGAAA
jgi:hypothetical protein